MTSIRASSGISQHAESSAYQLVGVETAADGTPTHTEGSRRSDIQGLRAVAVVLVVIYHANLGLSGGFVGVDVFFVISGYVITRMLTGELSRTNRISLKAFYLRRVRRLLPALGLMLTVVMLTSILLSPIGGQQVTARTGAAAALFSSNMYLIRFSDTGYFAVDANSNVLLHTWSLGVEEQFYLVFPAVLFGAWAARHRTLRIRKRATAILVLAVIAGLSFLLSLILTARSINVLGLNAGRLAFFSSLTRAWEFAAGGLLVLVSSRGSTRRKSRASILGWLGVVAVGYAAATFDGATPFPGTWALVPVVGTLCILVAGEGQSPNLVSTGLAIGPARRLGDLSYSWYLWHWPLIVFAAAWWPVSDIAAPMAAVISLAPAWLSYRFVEGPIRSARRPATSRTLVLASLCILLPLGSAVALEGSRSIVRKSEAIESYEYGRRRHLDNTAGCDNSTPLGERDVTDCTWEVPNAIGTAVLVGDSHAGHVSEAFVSAANEAGFNATIVTNPGCPFLDIDLGTYQNGTCRRFVVESTKELVLRRPDLVVIASSAERAIEASVSLKNPRTGDLESTADGKATIWKDGLTRTIKSLTSAGIDVVIVVAVPRIPDFDTRKCAVLRLMTESSVCSPSVELSVVDGTRRRAVQAETAAASAGGATTIDLADVLCPDGVCATLRAGKWIWYDTHITVYASEMLVPKFSSIFTEQSDGSGEP